MREPRTTMGARTVQGRRARGGATIRRLWIASVLAAGACSESDSPPAGATVEGFLMQGSPVVFVDDPSNAPAGDVPVAGAAVKAIDTLGDVVGTAVTGADGKFVLEGLPGGYLELEARRDDGSATPDAVAAVTAVFGASIPVGRSFAVPRADASEIALAGVPARARVLGTLQPLPPGLRVAPVVPGAVAPRTTPAEEWLYMVDLDPHADFGHDVEFVFVDAATGAVARVAGAEWPPSVNGVPMWLTESQVLKIKGLDPDRATLPVDPGVQVSPTPEVVQLPPARAQAPLPAATAGTASASLAKHNTDPESIFVILLQASNDPYKLFDMERMKNLFRGGGVPEANISRIASYLTNPQPLPGDISVAFEDTIFPQTLAAVNTVIQARLDAGLHSTLVVYITAHGGSGLFEYHLGSGRTASLLSIAAAQLKLKTTRACRVRVFLQFCNAGAFADELRQDFDTQPPEHRHDYVIYAACGNDEVAHADSLAWYTLNEPGTLFTKAFVPMARVQGGDVVGLLDPTNPHFLAPGLQSIYSGLEIFSDDNSYDTPFTIVHENDPSWCLASGAPTAIAGPPRTSLIGREVRLDGTASSDPDGDDLTFEWTVVEHPAGDLPVLDDPSSSTPAFTPDEPGTYRFRLEVTDEQGNSTADTVTVTVLRPALLPATVAEGIPAGAVAWIAMNLEVDHEDGPFALPGAPNPGGLPVMHPATGLPAGAHWAGPDVCAADHLHGPFNGHGDPAPGPPTTSSACGHGALVFLFPS